VAYGAGLEALGGGLLTLAEGASYVKATSDMGALVLDPSVQNRNELIGDAIGIGAVQIGSFASASVFSGLEVVEIKGAVDGSVQFVGWAADKSVCSLWGDEIPETPDASDTGEAAKGDKGLQNGTSGR
jgi:hypothetical protein